MDGLMLAMTGGASGMLGALLAYMLSVRIHSGQVSTTDADRLWHQVNKLTDALMTENANLRQRVHEVETVNRDLERRVAAAEMAEREASYRAERVERELSTLKGAIQPRENGGAL